MPSSPQPPPPPRPGPRPPAAPGGEHRGTFPGRAPTGRPPPARVTFERRKKKNDAARITTSRCPGRARSLARARRWAQRAHRKRTPGEARTVCCASVDLCTHVRGRAEDEPATCEERHSAWRRWCGSPHK
eukprot:scaffold7242_cov400-Prasinococcus_capsulatus_cf.AAC.5